MIEISSLLVAASHSLTLAVAELAAPTIISLNLNVPVAVMPGGVSNTTSGTLRYPCPGVRATKVTIPAEFT